VRFRKTAQAKARFLTRSSLPVLALGVIALAGCGSSSSTTSSSASTPSSAPAAPTTSSAAAPAPTGAASSASQPLSVAAGPGAALKFTATSLSTKAGPVAIDFTNNSPIGHNMTIESSAGTVVGATPTFSGGSKKLSLNLKPGTYKFYCSVPGHRQAGMEGTLTVQ
jgi:uncharacterized cupredoxin-like copper-binding protein